MDIAAERARLKQELEQIMAQANMELGKRHGQLEMLDKLEVEEKDDNSKSK